MGRKTVEEHQDIALRNIERENRKTGNLRDVTVKTLAQQLAELEKKSKMSPSQKLSSMSYEEWMRNLKSFTESREARRTTAISDKCFNWLSRKYESDLATFHKSGTAYTTILAWISDKSIEFMNL